MYRYEVDPKDLLHVENFEASELVYKPRTKKSTLLRKKAAKYSAATLEKLAIDQFGVGSVANERIFILRNGTILNCDNMDHFTVENFYADEGYEDEEAINAFLKDTGALRIGLHDGTLFYHLGPKKLTPDQIAQATAFAANWEQSVTN